MNVSPTMPIENLPAMGHAKQDFARYFYSGSALLLILFMFFGFQQFYLHGKAYPGRELTPPIRTLVIVHGISMTAWMVLFAVQPLLILSGKRRVHMMLGKIGAGLTAVIVIFGLWLGVASSRVNPPDLVLWGLAPRQFMAVPLISVTVFGALVAIGIWKRRQPEIHRPMMLLAALGAMPAAIDRIGPIRSLYTDTVWGTLFGPFFSTLVIGLALVVVHGALTRTFNRTLAIGYAGLVLEGLIVMRLATSGLWDGFADLLL